MAAKSAEEAGAAGGVDDDAPNANPDLVQTKLER